MRQKCNDEERTLDSFSGVSAQKQNSHPCDSRMTVCMVGVIFYKAETDGLRLFKTKRKKYAEFEIQVKSGWIVTTTAG